MRKVRCYECGRRYDHDEDAFCPRCGAFNLPGRTEDTVRLGELTDDRRDGLKEKGHTGSFLHREFHGEERERRRMGLDREEAPKQPRQKKRPEARGREHAGNDPRVAVIVIVLLILFQLLKTIF